MIRILTTLIVLSTLAGCTLQPARTFGPASPTTATRRTVSATVCMKTAPPARAASPAQSAASPSTSTIRQRAAPQRTAFLFAASSPAVGSVPAEALRGLDQRGLPFGTVVDLRLQQRPAA